MLAGLAQFCDHRFFCKLIGAVGGEVVQHCPGLGQKQVALAGFPWGMEERASLQFRTVLHWTGVKTTKERACGLWNTEIHFIRIAAAVDVDFVYFHFFHFLFITVIPHSI